MRACYSGHYETAIFLYRWNRAAFNVLNYDGESCLDLAAPHEELYFELARLDGITGTFSAAAASEFVKPASRAASLDSEAEKFHRDRGQQHHHHPHHQQQQQQQVQTHQPLPRHQRSMRSASPSLRQPLSVEVKQQRRLHPKGGLSKRSSFDSGINLYQLNMDHHGREKKDLKTVPKNQAFKKAAATLVRRERAKEEDMNASPPSSPFIDVEGLSDEDDLEVKVSKVDANEDDDVDDEEDQKVLTLAEQFIAAMPERIKTSASEPMQQDFCDAASQSDDLGVESMCGGDLANNDLLDLDFELNFDNYRSYTPLSSVSPASSSCLQSPASYSTFESPSPAVVAVAAAAVASAGSVKSPPCNTADLHEFLQASIKCERDLSNLTLSDQEQRELYEAAQIIQKAYRSYKGRKSTKVEREAKAAVVIQNYYRRYKQYLYWKQMARAATVIQNKYRTYCEHKRFKKSQEAATCIQNYYRTYKEHHQSRGSRESTPSTGLK